MQGLCKGWPSCWTIESHQEGVDENTSHWGGTTVLHHEIWPFFPSSCQRTNQLAYPPAVITEHTWCRSRSKIHYSEHYTTDISPGHSGVLIKRGKSTDLTTVVKLQPLPGDWQPLIFNFLNFFSQRNVMPRLEVCCLSFYTILCSSCSRRIFVPFYSSIRYAWMIVWRTAVWSRDVSVYIISIHRSI